jgi:hypothetical protein
MAARRRRRMPRVSGSFQSPRARRSGDRRRTRLLAVVMAGLRPRSSSDATHAELQGQPATFEPQPQHAGVPSQTGGPAFEAIGLDRRTPARLPALAFRDCAPPRVQRGPVPSPPPLVRGRRLRVPGDRPAGRLHSRDRPLQPALAVSVSDWHSSRGRPKGLRYGCPRRCRRARRSLGEGEPAGRRAWPQVTG